MLVERGKYGGWNICTTHKGRFVKMYYMDYTKKEAIEEFKEYLRDLDKKTIEEVNYNIHSSRMYPGK